MHTVIDYFYQISDRYPDAIALLSDDESVTYKNLRARSQQIASEIDKIYLQSFDRRVAPGDYIGISLKKSCDLYASILGIISLGAAYVPIDPSLDSASVKHILNTCHCRVVLAENSTFLECESILIQSPSFIKESSTNDFFRPRSTKQDSCYAIFTSGSTGTPKGVSVSHQNVINLVEWAIDVFSLGVDRRVLQYSTINFDASVLDIFPCLMSGATLCLPNETQRLSEYDLSKFVLNHKVCTAFLPPSLLSAINPNRFPTLKTVLTGGEACSTKTIGKWARNRNLFNLYGPTECTVLVTYKRMMPDTQPTNVGKEIPGTTLHLLNAKMAPVQEGELYISGKSVAQGYIEEAKLTRQKFTKIDCISGNETAYKTGDIFRRDEMGDLHFIGRTDRQVKVRGFRIELDEIEGALKKCECDQAAVTLNKRGSIVAYYTSKTNLAPKELRKLSSTYLPEYKIPNFFIRLDCFQTKSSGKIDYSKLPSIEIDVIESGDSPEETNTSTNIERVWSSILALPVESINGNSNFRELGGSSIEVLRLLSEVEKIYGTRVSFQSFLREPTVNFIYRSLESHER